MHTGTEPISRFIYTTYIRTTPERLWEALISPEFTRQYWYGMYQESVWERGAAWQMRSAAGEITDTGEIVEADKPHRLVLLWRHERDPEAQDEGHSRMKMQLEPEGDLVKLTVLHEIGRAESKLIGMVSNGWPRILSSLKSLLETGEPLVARTSPCAAQVPAQV